MNAMVTIRPLGSHETEAALRMKNQGWRQAYRGKLSDDILDRLDDSIEDIAEAWRQGFDESGSVPLVAVDDDGAIVGIAAGGEARGEDAPTDLELFMIYVLEEHYGTGLGKALTDAAIGDAAACVWVLDGNERAIAFYRKLGFEADGAREQLSERWNNLNEIRMVRPARDAARAVSTQIGE